MRLAERPQPLIARCKGCGKAVSDMNMVPVCCPYCDGILEYESQQRR